MKFCISPKTAIFFVEVIVLTTIVFLIRVESQSATVQKNAAESSKTGTLRTLVYIPEWRRYAMRMVNKLLSPSTLSHTDLFQYLVREILKVPNWKIGDLKNELDARFRTNQISETVVPYARALKTVIVVMSQLQEVRDYSKKIQNIWHKTPSNISSSPGLSSNGLFSSDIFADPDSPLQIINTLMEIPKSEVPNVIIQLKDYIKILDKYGYDSKDESAYKMYAQYLISFLKKDTMFDDLKSSVSEIQRISDSNRNLRVDGEKND